MYRVRYGLHGILVWHGLARAATGGGVEQPRTQLDGTRDTGPSATAIRLHTVASDELVQHIISGSSCRAYTYYVGAHGQALRSVAAHQVVSEGRRMCALPYHAMNG